MSAESSVRMSSRENSGIRYTTTELWCPECNASGKSVGQLVSHMKRVHGTSRIEARERVKEGTEILQVDPSDALRSVRGVGGDPRTLTNELPALPVPGHGEQYDDCGDETPHFCNGCGETHSVGRTCHRKECPRCAPAWAMKRATAAGAKLEATRRYLYAKRDTSPRFHHLVFSPPEEFAVARDDPLAAGYEIVKEFLDELGTDGGIIVYHPWRGAESDDRGFWKSVLFEGNDWGETVEQLEFGPHFHVIALGNFVPGGRFTQKLYERTGWTFKRITKGGDDSDSNVSIYDEYDLARALTYSLSHAGVSEEMDAYRYFGRVHNMSADEHIEEYMSEAVRSVAPDTLGLPYRSTSCTRELDEDEETARDGAEKPGPSNPDPELADEDEERTCGGRLLHIRNAPKYLRDREWAEKVNHADKLAEAYRCWLRGEPPPGS